MGSQCAAILERLARRYDAAFEVWSPGRAFRMSGATLRRPRLRANRTASWMRNWSEVAVKSNLSEGAIQERQHVLSSKILGERV